MFHTYFQEILWFNLPKYSTTFYFKFFSQKFLTLSSFQVSINFVIFILSYYKIIKSPHFAYPKLKPQAFCPLHQLTHLVCLVFSILSHHGSDLEERLLVSTKTCLLSSTRSKSFSIKSILFFQGLSSPSSLLGLGRNLFCSC